MRLVEFLRTQGEPEYNFDISSRQQRATRLRRPTTCSAIQRRFIRTGERIAIAEGKISTSMLQRELGIGYTTSSGNDVEDGEGGL
jgi:DNA segregation ATPase FtsK/SpoIIIE-like protein